jgi:multidrug efflux pump subunit AcrA (membrane-fusion protein)
VKLMNYPFLGSVRLAAAVATLIVWAPLLCSLGCDSRPQTEAASVPAPLPANPTPAQRAVPPSSDAISDAKHFSTTGPLVAEQQADIAAERDGHVTQIAVQIGDHVRKGQLLATLDDRMLRSVFDSQKARVASLHAQVAEWEAEQKSGEADLRRADMMRSEKIRSEEDWEHVKYKLDETMAEVARLPCRRGRR